MAAHPRGNDSLAQVVTSQQQQQQEITVAQVSPEAINEIMRQYKSFPKSESDKLEELRGWLMVLATVTASITWNAALNPPGGFWQADDAANGYVAGGSVFRDKNNSKYRVFFLFNFAGLYSSLVILVLLSINWLFRRTHAMVFNILVSMDLVSLFASVIFGSSVTVKTPTSDTALLIAYVIVMFVYLLYLMMRKSRD